MLKKSIQLFSFVIALAVVTSANAESISDYVENTAFEIAADDSAKIYDVVDQMPEIEGGIKEVYNNIKYPRAAISGRIEGRVFVKFVVDENGNVKNPTVIKDIGAGCGEAAVEGIKKVKFTPGKLNGQPVKVYYTLPVSFKINS
ncbi:MAG: energy transducer TonB [Gracilimonas sp.]|uniref:energy transducer TonB n=1 Tax=Gracilimonas TaxID=649462 RepID=UPI001B25E2EE|nr:energy transducer TonB [Gracilimonas sp.]MBO6586873.1 energy transducer TonB [Gracilimonas sp.]MBO6614639.1 energy transducer TonB [Gracilimonas sp.]